MPAGLAFAERDAVTRPFAPISALPGVADHASFAGLNAVPVVHGRPDGSFLTSGLNGSLDGAYFRQDRVIPIAGKLPAPDSTTGIVLAPRIARLFGVGVGGKVTYEFLPAGPGTCLAGLAPWRATIAARTRAALILKTE